MTHKYLPLLLFLFVLNINAYGQTEEEKLYPCRYNDQYKRLDFWLGEWDVYVKGTKTGTSSITKSEGGCTLHEDYKTSKGFFGRSMNYYDPEDQKYTQIWVDKFNGIIKFKEVSSKENYLQMQAQTGQDTLVNMTYVKDLESGNVTQTLKNSNDGGKTWKNSFVGVYKKRKTKLSE